MMSAKEAELEQHQQRITQLEAIEREYGRIKELLDAASQNEPLDKQASEIVIYARPDNRRILDANDGALNLLGYTLDELTTLTIDELERPGSQKEATTYIESSIEIRVYDCSYRHRDGYTLDVRVRHWPITHNSQLLLCYNVDDKSVRTQLWQELSRREDADYQFREKLKTLNEITIELGQQNTFADICRRSVELGIQKLGFDRLSLWFLDPSQKLMVGTFGVDEEGHIRDERGQSWAFAASYVDDFVNGKHDPIITYDGAPLYNEHSAIVGYGWHLSVPILDSNKFIGFMGADNLIHKQILKNYQPELLRLYGATIGYLVARQLEQETIRKLSTAVQHISSMIVVLNRSQVIEFVNDAFCQFSGYASPQILGQDLAVLFPPEAVPQIRRTISAGHDWRGELVNKKKNGASYGALVSISPVRLDDTIENFVIVQEDVTILNKARQKELALQLEYERARMLEMFVMDIGHELKTPLTIINTSNYIVGHSQDEAKRQKHVNLISAQVKTLNQMLDEILDIVSLTGISELKTELISLDDLVQNIVTSFIPALTAKLLTWQVEGQTNRVIQADSDKLARAIHEIIENAIQFTPAQGHIFISLHSNEEQVRLVIQDTGIGIPPDEIEKIFDRFYRVDKARTTRGTGLGLAIAKMIVEAHQGQIVVASVPGQGSRFEIILPI